MNGSYSTPVSIRLPVPALFLAASHSAEPCPIFWSTLYVHKCKGLWIGCGSRSPRELFCWPSGAPQKKKIFGATLAEGDGGHTFGQKDAD